MCLVLFRPVAMRAEQLEILRIVGSAFRQGDDMINVIALCQSLLAIGVQLAINTTALLLRILSLDIFCVERTIGVFLSRSTSLNNCLTLMWIALAPLPRHSVYLCAIAFAVTSLAFVLAGFAQTRVTVQGSFLDVKLREGFDFAAHWATLLPKGAQAITFHAVRVAFLTATCFAYRIVVRLVSVMLVKFAERLNRIASSAALQALLEKAVMLKTHVSFRAIYAICTKSVRGSRALIELCNWFEESTPRTTLERHVTSASESAFVEWGRRGADGPRFSGRLPSPSLLYTERCGL